MEKYEARPIRFGRIRETHGWKLKLYTIVFGDGGIDWERFEPALPLADAALPLPAAAQGRPGLGFVIAHQGRTGDYLVLGWWDNENELCLRVWVRRGPGEDWRPAGECESICVWDLEVIWAERNAWVETMLGAGEPDPAAWLARVHGAV